MKNELGPLRIALVASEAVPLAKTGGLADVTGGLARALAQRGHRVMIFHPLYEVVRENCRRLGIELHQLPLEFKVRIGDGLEKVRVWEAKLFPGGSAYLIGNQTFFGGRKGLYQNGGRDYPDNPERFIFFCEAVLAALRGLGSSPHIIHCHDWQTGFIPAYLYFRKGEDLFFHRTASIFTVHNLSFQGLFPSARMGICNLPWGAYNPEGIEFYGQINPIKAGLVYATLITTVSRKYAQEILSEEMGCGMEGVLRKRQADLLPILNGADYGEWNPETDRHLRERFSRKNLAGKAVCRDALLRNSGLRLPPAAPVIGMVSRITYQKGFDLLLQAAPRLLDLGVGLVILGQGDWELQGRVKELEKAFPGRVKVTLGFDEPLAHRIIAGCDYFLLPSRFEPAGLTQVYSLKYGTVPIVRATGGLDDTIEEYRKQKGTGNGFKFASPDPDSLVRKVAAALGIFRQRPHWDQIRRNAMSADFSWSGPAAQYERAYRLAQTKL